MTATLAAPTTEDATVYGSAKEAKRISGFADQTLDRWQRAGQDMGQRKVGVRAVRYDLSRLRTALAERAARNSTHQTKAPRG